MMRKTFITFVVIGLFLIQGAFANSGTEILNNTTETGSQIENLLTENDFDDDQEKVFDDENKLSENSGSALFYTWYSHCEINGKAVPCDEVLEEAFEFSNAMLQTSPLFHNPENWIPQLINFWIKAMIIGFILSAIGFVFWLCMLIDAIKYEKENRVMRILIIVFFSFLGALVYLFAEKIGRKDS